MGQAQAARLVIAAIVATVFLDGYEIAKKRPSQADIFRTLWSLGVMYVVLAFLADTLPEIAGAFSVLLIVTVLAAREQTLAEITSLIGGVSGAPAGVHGPVGTPGTPSPPVVAPPGVRGPVG